MAVDDPQREALERIRQAKDDGSTDLDLSDLGLKTLPAEIGGLGGLRSLHLQNNRLTSLPPEIGSLVDLAVLILERNRLTSLPPEIGGLGALWGLALDRNRITSLPPEIGSLGSLTDIECEHNRLASLPAELGRLKKLRRLRLQGNPLPDALLKLADKDVSGALAYIRDQGLEGGEPLHEAKLVLVGEGDVGKTCLLRALQGKPFKRQQTTKGMEVARQPLPLAHPESGATITLNAWDFGGQKDYQITHQFFFSPRSLYLVVWDPRSGHEKCDVDGWIGRIRLRVGDDAVILVVATHCRTGEPPPVVNIDKDELRRKHGGVLAGFFETDSFEDKKTKRRGIDELRAAIASEAANLRGMGDSLPPSWTKARKNVLALAKKKTPWIERGRFGDICRKEGLDGDATNGLLILLHELGQIVYFGRSTDETATAGGGDEDRRLGDVVILKPEWLAKAVCFVIEDGETRNAAGVLRYERLQRIWHDDRKRDARYEPKLYPYFLALMEKYDICYRLEDGRSSLVPQLITRGRPEGLPWYPEDEPGTVPQLALSCEMDEVPPGLVPLMIVRTHRFSKQDHHWELGAYLDYRAYGTAHMALVDRELMFTVRGEYPPHLMTLLTDSFEVLVDDVWPGLKERYRLSVPCPNRIGGRLCRGRFELDALRAFFADGDTVERCRRCKQKLDIGRLLLGLATPGLARDEPQLRLEALATEINERVKVVAAEGRQTLETARALAGSAAEQFRQILASMHNETAAAPGMFTLLPEGGKWLKVRGKSRYSLTLWCEYPECPHPLCKIGSEGEGEYRFDRTAHWLIKAAPVITWTVRILKVAATVASGAPTTALPSWGVSDAEAALKLMGKCASVLPQGDLKTVAGTERPTGFFKRPEGADLRVLHELLNEVDPSRAWGGLRRVLTKTGDYLWLCGEHYAKFDPALPKVP